MRILIIGGRGMLGRTLCEHLESRHDVIPVGRQQADISRRDQVEGLVLFHRPDVVINCAAYTKVDDCESDPFTAFKVNAIGAGNVAKACDKHGIRLIHISTDYVFDGEKEAYTENDKADGGRTVYGQSKYAGERFVRLLCQNSVIARVAWLYGKGGPSFVHTMMNAKSDTLKVVSDQFGNPTSALAVAREIEAVLERPDVSGIVHMTCKGIASWADFAREIFKDAGIDKKVEDCSTSEYPRPAPRPRNTSLEKRNIAQFGLPEMPNWKDALSEFIDSEFR